MKKEQIIFGIAEQINEMFSIDTENVTEDARLMEELGLSSFDIMLLLPEIERKFGVDFSVNDLRSMFTVGDVSDFIIRSVSNDKEKKGKTCGGKNF